MAIDETWNVIPTIVSRTAERLDINLLELQPLAEVIDPELLRRFVADDAVHPDSTIRFRYHGCVVRVTGDGEVSIDAAGDRTDGRD